MKKPYHILLIEKEEHLACQMQEWLGQKAQVLLVSDVAAAKNLAQQSSWHLIIIDYNSLQEESLEITQIAKKNHADIPVLIIAENINVDFILDAMQYHADGLLFKPLKKEDFVDRVYALAEQALLKKAAKIILAVGAHPDDVEFGCGGTLAKLQAEGHALHIVTLSLGESGGSPEMRKQEAQRAAACLHAELHLGDFKDTKILHNKETIGFIEAIVREINPTQVYTHSIHDNHQDHKNIFQATITACRPIHNIFCYESPSTSTKFYPNAFINIENFMEKKLEMLACFESQAARPYLKPDLVQATARYWGRYANYQLVEPMEVIKGNF